MVMFNKDQETSKITSEIARYTGFVKPFPYQSPIIFLSKQTSPAIPYCMTVCHSVSGRNCCHGLAFKQDSVMRTVSKCAVDEHIAYHMSRLRLRMLLRSVISQNYSHIEDLLWKPPSGLMLKAVERKLESMNNTLIKT